MNSSERAARHSALGDERRLRIVDHLTAGDHTVIELARLVDMPGNLLAHHLLVLERAGLIERHESEGDRRRRYVSLHLLDQRPSIHVPNLMGAVAFVCTHNSARSQFAAALWESATGIAASSAGTHPADKVHPKAVRIASEFGIDISRATPKGYESLAEEPDVIISVCDRARESEVPPSKETFHWSIPDPVPIGTLGAFRSAFNDIQKRVDHLVREQKL